ncbi:MAG: long-chain fatty acid--CoA ligase [Candidatus Neomarinimicrobiota bacterium]
MREVESIPAYLLKQAEQQPEVAAVRYRKEGEWRTVTWSDYATEVEQAGRALISLGLEPMGKVCILGYNRPEWVIFDLAAMMAGGVPAGIYETSSPEGVAYILSHSEATIVLVENTIQLEKILGERKSLPKLRQVILMKGATSDDPMVLGWEEFLGRGDSVQLKELEERGEKIEPGDLATLIYTSGTTGPPKAVMLSHRNLIWTAQTAIDMFEITTEDSSLSYLPLSHIAEQMFTIHAPMIAGWKVDFAESQEKAAENLRDVQPTIFFGVPRVWEKVFAAVYPKLQDVGGAKKGLLSWARWVASKVHGVRNEGGEVGWGTRLQFGIARKLVLSKLKYAMGLGRARFCVTGAAPISATVLEFFASVDIPILEVYGQSEGSGPTSFNRWGQTRYGSVGPPLPGTEVKTAEDGEILLKGPNVFPGYFKDEAATADTLVNRWLHSGDLGKFDEDGFLWITGRKKDIIVTSGGKNIAPAYIEGLLQDSDLVEQAIVIGDGRKYLTALIVVDEQATGGDEGKKASGNKEILDQVQEEIARVNSRVSRVENIRKFRILGRPLMQEKGELTPTLKMVRHVIAENWVALIEEMYEEDN